MRIFIIKNTHSYLEPKEVTENPNYREETKELTHKELLDYINEDRSEEWTDYDESDELHVLMEALSNFTDFDLIGVKNV
jgi:hypothetical protein